MLRIALHHLNARLELALSELRNRLLNCHARVLPGRPVHLFKVVVRQGPRLSRRNQRSFGDVQNFDLASLGPRPACDLFNRRVTKSGTIYCQQYLHACTSSSSGIVLSASAQVLAILAYFTRAMIVPFKKSRWEQNKPAFCGILTREDAKFSSTGHEDGTYKDFGGRLRNTEKRLAQGWSLGGKLFELLQPVTQLIARYAQ